MPFYRKIPIVVQAEQVIFGCYDKMEKLFGEEPANKYGYIVGTHHPGGAKSHPPFAADHINYFEMWIKTLEGTMTASFGDYIIKGVNGEFYPVKPDIFNKTYEYVAK